MTETLDQTQLNDLRRRIANGRDFTYDEVKEALRQIRQARQEAGDSSTKKQAKNKQAADVDLSDLKGE